MSGVSCIVNGAYRQHANVPVLASAAEGGSRAYACSHASVAKSEHVGTDASPRVLSAAKVGAGGGSVDQATHSRPHTYRHLYSHHTYVLWRPKSNCAQDKDDFIHAIVLRSCAAEVVEGVVPMASNRAAQLSASVTSASTTSITSEYRCSFINTPT